MSYQVIIIEGGLTRDAEFRQVGQSSVAKIDVAVGSSYTRRDGQRVTETEYFNNIEVWDKPGINSYLTKGQNVLVQMQQKTETYTDQQGQQRKSIKYRAQVVQLIGSRPQTQPVEQPEPIPQRPVQQRPVPQPRPSRSTPPSPVPPPTPGDIENWNSSDLPFDYSPGV